MTQHILQKRRLLSVSSVIWLSALFGLFFLYSILALTTPNIFISPDETANAFFAKTFSQTGKLEATIPVAPEGESLMPHPRSVGVVKNQWIPLSFYGFPVFAGVLARIVGKAMIPFLTPLLSIGAVVAWYFLIQEVFNKRIAIVSTILLALNPAFWYYAARGLMHNAAFIDLVIIGLWFLVSNFSHHRVWRMCFGALLLGVAVTFRASEAIWVAAIALGVLFALRMRFRRVTVYCAALCFLLPIAVYTYSQIVLFGGLVTSAAITAGEANQGSGILHAVQYLFFPFGISINRSLGHAVQYLFLLFPFLGLGIIAGVAGGTRVLRNARRGGKRKAVAFVAFLLVSMWLVLYYGSWDFTEGSNPREIILGSSYLRYWLPIFVFSIPFTASVLLQCVVRSNATRAIAILFFLATLYQTASRVLFDDGYGILAIRSDLQQNERVLNEAKNYLPPTSIVITGKADKIFFPSYAVMVDVPTTETGRTQLVTYARKHPIFFVTSGGGDADQKALLEVYGSLEHVGDLDGEFALYRFSAVGVQ
jgi:hypothetical protein